MDTSALGGHSLLAMKVLARIRQAFEIDLGLQDLFAHPTVSEMAQLILRRLVALHGWPCPPLAAPRPSRPR